jgi:SulP family sulfate permease
MSVSIGRRKPRSKPHYRDLIAGVSVALVLLPQALAYAELAGLPAYVGIYAAALPPIVASLYGSSPYLQVGPTALTSLLTLGVLMVVVPPGGEGYVGMAALLALIVGVVRLLLGLLRLGRIAYLLSEPVILGFTTGAGVLIVASQLPTALGVPFSPERGIIDTALWTLANPQLWRFEAIVLTLLTLVLVTFGKRLGPLFPGVLVAVVLGVLYSVFVGYEGALVGAIPAGFPVPSLTFPWGSLTQLVVGGVVIAVVGFAEVASIARTYATEERQRWDPNRELMSQGAANIASGLVGAFPVGGSFSRSALNREAGARTRWSGAVAGLVILLLIPFVGLLAELPRAVLAAIVIAAVTSLIRLPPMLRLRRYSRPQFLTAGATFILTLTLEPRVDLAIVIGVLLSMSIHLLRELYIDVEGVYGGGALHLTPHGVLWFGSAASFEEKVLEVLAAYPQTKKIVIHFEGLGRVDVSGMFVLQRLVDDMRRAGIEVELRDVPPQAKKLVTRFGHKDHTVSER